MFEINRGYLVGKYYCSYYIENLNKKDIKRKVLRR